MFVGIRTLTVPATESASTVCVRAMPRGPAKLARFKFVQTIAPIITDRASVTARAITVTACTVSRVTCFRQKHLPNHYE